jgi:probable rRNA maturation factor
VSVDVINESAADIDVLDFTRLARFVLERMRIHPQADMAVKFVDVDEMSRLNELWMDKTGPTDVLAFPMDELRPGTADGDSPDGVVGDVVLAPRIAAKQAAEAGHSAVDEMHVLTVHGILHLLGYDHAEPAEHREMFGLQTRLLTEWQGVRRGETVEP